MLLEESEMAGAWSCLAAASSIRVRHGGKPNVQQGRSTLAPYKTSSGMYMGINRRKQRDKGIKSISRLLVSTFAWLCPVPLSYQTLTISQHKGLFCVPARVWEPEHQPLVSKPGLRGHFSLVQLRPALTAHRSVLARAVAGTAETSDCPIGADARWHHAAPR